MIINIKSNLHNVYLKANGLLKNKELAQTLMDKLEGFRSHRMPQKQGFMG